MSIIEFIGFIITMVAMVMLFFKRTREERYRRENPDEMEEEGLPPHDPLKQFLKALEGTYEEEEKEQNVRPPSPPPMQVQQTSAKKRPLSNEFQFQPKMDKHHLDPKLAGFHQKREIDSRKLGSSLDDRYGDSTYEVHRRESESYARKVVDRLHSRRDMMICHEIFSRPKGW